MISSITFIAQAAITFAYSLTAAHYLNERKSPILKSISLSRFTKFEDRGSLATYLEWEELFWNEKKGEAWSFFFFNLYLMIKTRARSKYKHHFTLEFPFERDSFKALRNMSVKVEI